jgi:hypothetical protein
VFDRRKIVSEPSFSSQRRAILRLQLALDAGWTKERDMKKLVATLIVLATMPLTAQAAQARTFMWQCNLGGQAARLTANVEALRGGGTTGGYNSGFVSDGSANLVYSGQLLSANARYSFTGENGFADFVDLINGERFRVQFVAQGRQLMLIANPPGPGPTRYMCELIG